jgi:hypothetical protein
MASVGGEDEAEKKNSKFIAIDVDNKVLNCYYQINIDSIPGGESPPTATL